MEQLIIFVAVAFVLSFLEKRAKARRLEEARRNEEAQPESPEKGVSVDDMLSSIFGVEKIEPETEYTEEEGMTPDFAQGENKQSTVFNNKNIEPKAAQQPQFNDAAFNINDYITEGGPQKRSQPIVFANEEVFESEIFVDVNDQEKILDACWLNTKTASIPLMQQAVVMKEILDKPVSLRNNFSR